MKIFRYLLLGAGCLVVLGNNKLLLADSADENIITMPIIDARIDRCNDTFIFKENIHDRIVQLYSPHEIMEMLHNSRWSTGKRDKPTAQIYDLFNERYSNILEILMAHKESEKFYKQKNAGAKLKNYYLMLQIALVTGVAVGLCYLLYRIGNMMQWPPLFSSQGTEGNVQKFSRDALLSDKASRVVNVELPHTQSIEVLQQEPINYRQEFVCNTWSQDEVFDAVRLEEPEEGAIQVSQQHNFAPSVPMQALEEHANTQVWTAIREEYLADNQLREAVEQQIQHARNIGLELRAVQLNVPEGFATRAQGDNRRLRELIVEQIAYAQSIGAEIVGL